MFKRSQQDVSDSSKHWYQDKYQHVLTQRNLLAVIALFSLTAALVSALALLHFAPLKSVEPYLIQIDEKTGITQRVEPISRKDYAASAAVDKYFVSHYLRLREGYNATILRYNYKIVALMSSEEISRRYRPMVDVNNPEGLPKRLGIYGQREVRIKSLAYITNPDNRRDAKSAAADSNSKIIQARITTIETVPNQADRKDNWVITMNFEYANLDLNEDEQLLNPLGFIVTSYQIERET